MCFGIFINLYTHATRDLDQDERDTSSIGYNYSWLNITIFSYFYYSERCEVLGDPENIIPIAFLFT